MENTAALEALAAKLEEARIMANAIPATEAQSGVYGQVSAALESVLRVIFHGTERAEYAYKALRDGCDVPAALEYARQQSITEWLAQFTDDALTAMCNGGYFNDFHEPIYATLEEVSEVFAYRKERAEDWEAHYYAGQVAEVPSSLESDTVVLAQFDLEVNGEVKDENRALNRYFLVYRAARELQAHGVDVEANEGFLQAVYESRLSGGDIIAGDLEHSTLTMSVRDADMNR